MASVRGAVVAALDNDNGGTMSKVYKKSGKLPPPRNLVAEAVSQRRLGGGRHHTRALDVARGRRRRGKHPAREEA